jgi:hypothetical protein
LVGSLDVRRKFFVEDHSSFLGRKFVRRRAAAVTESAEIDGHDMEACGGEAPGEVVPHFALAVALVEQKDSRTGFGCREIGAFKPGPIGCGEVYDLWRRRFLGPGWEAKEEGH